MISWPPKSTLQRLLELAGLHFTTSERSGPFWQSMLHNFLSRPLLFLGWSAAMLFWLDFHQTQSNLYKWFRMHLLVLVNEPKRAHVTPLFVSLHWLPVAARIQFKTLMLAYRTITGSATTYFHSLLRIYIPSRSPTYFHSLLRIYIPSRSLRSASERASWYHHREAQNHSPEHSLSPFLAGGMIFPSPSGMLDPCQSSSSNWKRISFNTTWLHHKKNFKVEVCLFKMNRFMYSPIVSRFG